MMCKRRDINVKYRKLLRGRNLNPRVLLTRLTENDVARYKRNDRNERFNGSGDQPYIKEEPEDDDEGVPGAMYYEDTWQQEIQTRIKTEKELELGTVKIEPIDTYENTIDNPSFSNLYGTFSCKICFQAFNNYEEFVVHKNLAHKNIHKYVCQMCDEKFNLSAHLNSHMLAHLHLENAPLALPLAPPPTIPLALPSITQSSSTSNSTKRQKIKYNQKKTKEEPQNDATQLKPCKCSNCSFKTESKLKLIHCKNTCNTNPKSNFNHNNGSYRCDLCFKTYINKTALNGHMRYHSLRGDIISKRTLKKKGIFVQCNTSNAVESKNAISVRKKNIECNVCKKRFVLQKRFEMHMKLHKSVKITNSAQNTIGKSLKRKNIPKLAVKFGLADANVKGQNHKIQLKPFQCQHCENFYTSKRSLAEHTKLFHDYTDSIPSFKGNKYPIVECHFCNAFITKCNLNRHIGSFHPNGN